MQRFLQLMKDNVVGPEGFHLRCRVRMLDGKLDVSLNTRVQNAFWKWTENGMTTDGHLSWPAFLKQVVEVFARDGEYLFEIVTGQKYRDGVALNPIESDLLDENLNGNDPSTGNEIRMGVEIDNSGRPVAYHFLTYHPGDPGIWQSMKSARRYRRVPADRVVHIFTKRRIGQTRGEPAVASIVRDLKMLDGYREAEVTKRRMMASTVGFFTKAVPVAVGGVDALGKLENPAEPSAPLVMDVAPGEFKELPPGVDVKAFDSSSSSTDFKQFDSQIKRSLAMGLGISAFSLGMETDGVSYSTGRSVLVEDRDFYRSHQSDLTRVFMRRVFPVWLKFHMLQQDSVVPPSRFAAVLDKSSLRPRGWDWVDPLKEVNANAEALRTRQTSLSRIAAQRGLDFDDLVDEIQADEQALRDRGLSITLVEPKVLTSTDESGNKADKGGEDD
jgi:lambda family phage portal protein